MRICGLKSNRQLLTESESESQQFENDCTHWVKAQAGKLDFD